LGAIFSEKSLKIGTKSASRGRRVDEGAAQRKSGFMKPEAAALAAACRAR
jgi:hypothetical protein